MVLLQIVYVLAAYDVDLLVPFRIKTRHSLKLFPLTVRQIGEILRYFFYHTAKITNFPQFLPIFPEYISDFY